MTKLAVLFSVCLVVLFAAAAISATPSITMDFVGEFRAGRPAIVRVTTTDIDLSNTVTIEPKVPTGPDAGKTYWDHSYIQFGQGGIVNDMNRNVLEQNNFLIVGEFSGDATVLCVDEATLRPLVNLDYAVFNSIMSFYAINSAHKVNFPVDKYGSFTFLCPMTIDTSQVYAPEITIMTATQSGQSSIDFTLAPPAAWSWREPLVTINSASYSANTGNLLGGKIKFQFSTDTAGIHCVSIRNGPQPTFYNRRTQEFTSYQCGDNVEAYIISGSNNGLEIHVKDSAANGAPITCTVDVDGYMSSAFTERSQVVIAMDTVLVAHGIDFPVLDATFSVSGVAVDGIKLDLTMTASDLNFSASPLHTNSTVEIRFTGIDVNTIKPTNNEYRQDEVCSGLKGTFSQDGKSVFIKDISQVPSSFGCNFNFVGTKIIRLDEFTPVPTVQVLVDGVSLYNRAVRSTSFPLYLPLNTGFPTSNSQIYQDDSTIKHVVEFSLSDQSESYGVVPQKPVLVLSYAYSATWPTASYGDVLSCEATSPSSSAYTPLVMTFDLDRRTWTADLSTLIDTDAYQVKFRCTRSEAVVTTFDIVQNTPNQLNVSFLDVVSGKIYIYSQSINIVEQTPKIFLKKPTNPALPVDFTQYFIFSGSVLITDFATASSVADDVSTKVLAAIKAGYDAYDAQPSPATPTTLVKLSPKPVNKAQIVPFDPNFPNSDYSPSFAQIMYNLYYTILGFQFQQPDVQSVDIYGASFSDTAHSQRKSPPIVFSQSFTSGSTYAELQALFSYTAYSFAAGEMGSAFYKDAYSTSPAIPFQFNTNGFLFVELGYQNIMNPVTACGYYQVGYTPTYTTNNYEFVYDDMISNNQSKTRFTCAYAEACSSDADCGDPNHYSGSGYCSNGTCAGAKPFLKYPYVQYTSVADFSEYDGYNNSVVASLFVAIVAVIVAIVM